ncbi:cytochrome-c oxidase, cbb3-type subunit III [Alphaproteobacteria bacterium]|nr:cytochrome-c oxidase, cbb3-type subunit III [Alphaproteobacteria bacterium]
MSDKDKPVIDEYSGVETTGHDWDGIQELNNPLPRWWLWSFYVCILWAVAYWIFMPSWPLVQDYTRGFLGYSQRAVVAGELRSLTEARADLGRKLLASEPEKIVQDKGLLEFAYAAGKTAFADNCAGCHGSGAGGAKGYPNLNDDDWLWGGSLNAIETSIRFGIRATHEETHYSEMPAFGVDEMLGKEEISTLVTYLQILSGQQAGKTENLELAKTLFADNCASCHGDDATGDREQGAPNLKDAIWLFGKDKKTIFETVHAGRKGMMPAWDGRLDPVTIRALAVYIHTRGGGE